MLIVKKEVKKLPGSRVNLQITVGKSSIKMVYEEVLKDYVSKAKINGFRLGRAPISEIERRFKSSIESQVLENVINQAFKEALLDISEKPLHYAAPLIKGSESYKMGEDFSFTAEYDVFPKVEISDFYGIEVTLPEVTVSDTDVEWELKNLQDRYSTVTEKSGDAVAQKGDIVIVDFCELGANKREVAGSKREDFTFTLGSAQNAYGFDKEIWGMKKGEERVFEKKVEKKSVLLKVSLKKLQFKRIPSLDDDFAQNINKEFRTLDDLKSNIREGMEKKLEECLRNSKLNQILDELVMRHSFDIPESLINWQMDEQRRYIAQQSGMDEKVFDQFLGSSNNPMKEVWKSRVLKSLGRQIILESLLEKSEVEISDEDLQVEYNRQAEAYSMEPDEVKKYFVSQDLVDRLKYNLSLEKIRIRVMDSAKVKKGKRQDFMTFIGAGA